MTGPATPQRRGQFILPKGWNLSGAPSFRAKRFPTLWAYLSPVASDLPRCCKAAGLFRDAFMETLNALTLASPET